MRYAETPIVRDMRQTAQEFHIPQRLRAILECTDRHCSTCEYRLRDVLEDLGVDRRELPPVNRVK